MIIERRRLARTLLLAAVLCGCASQHHRTETAADDPSREAADDASDSEMAEHEDADDARAAADVEPGDRPGAAARRRAADADATAGDDDGATNAANTGVNERDRGGETLTPGDQSNDESDLEITRRIRETVVEDDALSFTAKNVKIITVDGRVTLRGPVRSQAERAAIEQKAVAVAGPGQVVNQLEIK